MHLGDIVILLVIYLFLGHFIVGVSLYTLKYESFYIMFDTFSSLILTLKFCKAVFIHFIVNRTRFCCKKCFVAVQVFRNTQFLDGVTFKHLYSCF